MSSIATTIHFQRLKQLEARFGLERVVVDKALLAEVLVCSNRNVANIMKSLSALLWVEWKPGLGRGNKSTLMIMHSFETLLIDRLQLMITTGGLSEACQFAERFHFQHVFKRNLPEWLKLYSDDIDRPDELVALVSYSLPSCHPRTMTNLNAGLYVNAMFDTLIQFDSTTHSFVPHLAHEFHETETGFAFRIRPDVYFHNGELLTPEHVEHHLKRLQSKASLNASVFSGMKHVRVNKRWVEVELLHQSPLLLHALADIHSSVYLDNMSEPSFPFGTGSYRWETRAHERWSLVKNDRYFGTHGILKRAQFWTVDDSNREQCGHVIEYDGAHVDLQQDGANNLITHSKLTGCQALCIHSMLAFEIRELLAKVVTQGIATQTPERSLCGTLFGDDHVYLAIVAADKHQSLQGAPETSLAGQEVSYWAHQAESLSGILDSLRDAGVQLVAVNERNSAMIWLNDYLFGQDRLLDQYYWLLDSEVAQYLLPSVLRNQWMDEVLYSDNLAQLFKEIENQCKQKRFIVPLGEISIAFKAHPSLRGHSVDSIGLMRLSGLWLDKR
ncbi:hypothetical protein BCU70_19565 [Vibrio sp. 10N.286.49.C2]|uniref:SgrR family transcriptional regulator n=1 Tax=unclassified Vibrio TaxID=2614977 RepID=UPI000C85B632|nr:MULTISPECIES: SgrR family transcriptional regulator [unclassified Vibrio]PMH34860.1 hypothetical protein BCU70_19565 [Vibrio sp. 10N.286.49.C2]PMH51352.1 hypothetical protein BCU66_16550 [Vibrio sp. 10N.286.49.B1]PMH78640.1 hypothetical protein BCU58_08315 [Vibrio sp. 10N.286.48.B7]